VYIALHILFRKTLSLYPQRSSTKFAVLYGSLRTGVRAGLLHNSECNVHSIFYIV